MLVTIPSAWCRNVHEAAVWAATQQAELIKQLGYAEFSAFPQAAGHGVVSQNERCAHGDTHETCAKADSEAAVHGAEARKQSDPDREGGARNRCHCGHAQGPSQIDGAPEVGFGGGAKESGKARRRRSDSDDTEHDTQPSKKESIAQTAVVHAAVQTEVEMPKSAAVHTCDGIVAIATSTASDGGFDAMRVSTPAGEIPNTTGNIQPHAELAFYIGDGSAEADAEASSHEWWCEENTESAQGDKNMGDEVKKVNFAQTSQHAEEKIGFGSSVLVGPEAVLDSGAEAIEEMKCEKSKEVRQEIVKKMPGPKDAKVEKSEANPGGGPDDGGAALPLPAPSGERPFEKVVQNGRSQRHEQRKAPWGGCSPEGPNEIIQKNVGKGGWTVACDWPPGQGGGKEPAKKPGQGRLPKKVREKQAAAANGAISALGKAEMLSEEEKPPTSFEGETSADLQSKVKTPEKRPEGKVEEDGVTIFDHPQRLLDELFDKYGPSLPDMSAFGAGTSESDTDGAEEDDEEEEEEKTRLRHEVAKLTEIVENMRAIGCPLGDIGDVLEEKRLTLASWPNLRCRKK